MTSKLILGTSVVFLVWACNQTPPPVRAPVTSTADPVTIVVAVAKGIEAAPAQADSVLAAYNLTADAYEWRLHEIATDSGAAARYTVAMQ